VGRHPGGVAATSDQSEQATAAGSADHDFAAGDQRQGLPGQIAVLGLMGVRVVHARRDDVIDPFPQARTRIGEFGQFQQFRATEFGQPDATHIVTVRESPRPRLAVG
jgi:hypothetical protein